MKPLLVFSICLMTFSLLSVGPASGKHHSPMSLGLPVCKYRFHEVNLCDTQENVRSLSGQYKDGPRKHCPPKLKTHGRCKSREQVKHEDSDCQMVYFKGDCKNRKREDMFTLYKGDTKICPRRVIREERCRE